VLPLQGQIDTIKWIIGFCRRLSLPQVNFVSMLTQDEKNFIQYWEHNRIKKKNVLRQLSVGLPLGVLLVAAISINFFSGWYKRAQMMINTDPSLIIIIIIASLLIVVFITIFSARHRWEMNEQHYKELCDRIEKDSSS
jgi:uncharacterized membrane protein